MYHYESKIVRLETGQVVAVGNRYSLYHSMMDGSDSCPGGEELEQQNVLIPASKPQPQ